MMAVIGFKENRDKMETRDQSKAQKHGNEVEGMATMNVKVISRSCTRPKKRVKSLLIGL